MSGRWMVTTAVAALVLVAVAVWAFSRLHEAAAPPAVSEPAPAVTTAVVRYGTFYQRVAAHGKVGPPAGADARLAFNGSGVLKRIDVAVGDRVTPGMALAEYGGADVARAQLAAAEAKVAAMRSKLVALERGIGSADSDRAAAQTALRDSQAKVMLDRRTLAREQTLFSAGVAAQKDVEAAAEQLAVDESDQRANEAKLKATVAGLADALTQARSDYENAVSDAAVARRTLENTTLRAPSAGVVVAVFKHVGEFVDSSTPVVEIGPSASSTITLSVAGPDGRRVALGAPVDLIDTAIATRGRGRVVGVVPSVDSSSQTTTIVVSGVPPGALSGDPIDASIVAEVRRGLLVPATAVVTDPQAGRTMVFVRRVDRDGKATFVARSVSVAASDDHTALLTGGVRAGERVAVEGSFDLLAPGGGD
jgi:multidrug efflux pump subunit AcrA (membrane-fusion protein)